MQKRRGLSAVLTGQHRRIETLIFRLLDDRVVWSTPCVQNRFSELTQLLRRHMSIEESVLFPELEERVNPRDEALNSRLRTEHRQIEWGLEFIWRLVASGAPAEEIRNNLEILDALLAGHVQREEWVAYDVYEQVLGVRCLGIVR
jgi:hemerythrin-like domain-containing protein